MGARNLLLGTHSYTIERPSVGLLGPGVVDLGGVTGEPGLSPSQGGPGPIHVDFVRPLAALSLFLCIMQWSHPAYMEVGL